MATISRFHAVVSFKGLRLSGLAGWVMWLFVHITFLTGFKNRFSAMLHWTNTFAAGGRAERTITVRQVVGRVALEQAGGEELTRQVLAAADRHPDDTASRASSARGEAGGSVAP